VRRRGIEDRSRSRHVVAEGTKGGLSKNIQGITDVEGDYGASSVELREIEVKWVPQRRICIVMELQNSPTPPWTQLRWVVLPSDVFAKSETTPSFCDLFIVLIQVHFRLRTAVE